MSDRTWTRVPAKTATEITSQLALEGEALRLLRADLTPAAYFDALMASRQYLAALAFLAHALPKREAVSWACQCVRMVCNELDEKAAAALAAAEQWVQEPSEPHRRAAQAAAENVGFDTPAGCAAAAVFFSGGSLGPPHVPDVPPAPTLTAQAVTGCVMLTAVLKEPEKTAEKHQAFLQRGLEIASGA